MPSKSTPLLALGAFASILVLAAAFYLEQSKGLEPCLLCMVQRGAVAAFGAFCLLGWITSLKPRLWSCFAALAASLGIYAAGRQLWLQSLPKDQVPLCGGATIEYLLESFPFFEAISLILKGSGECAKVQWTFIHLSIPAWSMLFFCFALFLSLLVLFSKNQKA